MKSILITNRCTKTRIQTKDGHIIQAFSAFYSHPAMVKEDWWHLLKVGSEKVMIDEDTMVIMKDMECEWGYKAKSDVILTCKLTSTIADEDERMKQWNKLYTFSMGVKKDIDGANDVDDLSKQLEHTTISDKGSDSGESSATTESIPATLK